MILGTLWKASLPAADLTSGYSFIPGEHNVTHTKLNGIVGDAVINPEFFTGKSAAQPGSSDTLLFYQASSGAFKKCTLSVLLIGATNLIVAQTEDTAPATNDFVLTYDTSTATFKKVALFNLLPLAGFNEMVIPPDIGFKLYITSNGVPYWSSMTNLHQQIYRHYQLANPSNSVSDPSNYFLANAASPVKTDALLVWAGNTNKYSTFSNLVTRSTACTTATGGDMAWGYSTNQSQIVAYKMVDLQKWVTNQANSRTLALTNNLPQTWTTQGVTLANGPLVNAAHGLGGTPQCVRWVLVATALDGGWGIGREVPITSFCDSSTGKPWFAEESDGTAVNVVAADTGTMQVRHSVSGVATNAVQAKWTLKGYVTYFPTFP